MDLWVVDIRRFSDLHDDRDWTRDRTLEAYGKHYTVAFPLEEYESGAAAHRLAALRAAQGAARRVRLQARLGAGELVRAGGGRAARPLFLRPRQLVRRRSARSTARRASGSRCSTSRPSPSSSCAAAMPSGRFPGSPPTTWRSRPAGSIYTQLLNSRGGIECDLTVARLAADRYYIVTGTGFRTHDFAWIRQNIGAGLDATPDRRHRAASARSR